MATDFDTFKAGDLEATIGNNASMGEVHGEGYNGIFSLKSTHCATSPYVPRYAGWNLEHYFDADPVLDDRKIFMEPRHVPMHLTRVDDATAELCQEATPHYGVESCTTFRMRAPHYIDFTFRCTPRKRGFTGDFFGVFWASYMHAPEDKSIYFLSGDSSFADPLWVQFCTQYHNHYSSVRQQDDAHEFGFETDGKTLFALQSNLRYGPAFYYGRFENMVHISMFKTDQILRFAHSPSGGGRLDGKSTTNPAWDFQFLVPGYAVDHEYRLDARLVFKPWAGREDVIAEAKKYLQG